MLAGCGTRLSNSAFQPFQVNPSASAGSGGQQAIGPNPQQSAPGGILPTAAGPSSNTGGGPGAVSGGNGGGPNPVTSSSSNSNGGKANYASDVGVTATTITVCNVVTQGGPFGPYQFTPSYYGAAAYFAELNRNGGINGRKVDFITHPDDGSDSDNQTQIHTCVDQNKAFAFVANNIYAYAGASYLAQKHIPDIGGQPISTIYYQYPNMFSIDGLNQLHQGKPVGKQSKAYRWNEQATFFKQREHVTHVGVVYYDQSSSQYGANEIIADYQHAGVKVSTYQVNLGLPNFASAVAQMKADGVDLVADAVDLNGTQKLCQAIEQNSAFENQMKVHLSTVADWDATLGQELSQTPKCLGKSWSDGYNLNFQDTSNPEIAKFQTAMHQYFPSWSHVHEWSLEGWIAASWFTEAAKSCGAALTHQCVINYMNNKPDFGGDGVTVPYVSFRPLPPSFYNKATRHCVSAAQWSLQANRWVTRASPSSTCFMVKGYGFNLDTPT